MRIAANSGERFGAGGAGRRGVWRFGVCAVAVMALAACGAGGEGSVPSRGVSQANFVNTGRTSPVGDYLAARHAQIRRDAKAADFMQGALAGAPENETLLRRAYLLLALEGRLTEASAVARRLMAVNPRGPISGLSLVLDDAAKSDFAAATVRLRTLPARGPNLYLKPLLMAWSLVGEGDSEAALAALAPLRKRKALRVVYDFHRGLILDLAGRAEAAEAAYIAARKGRSNSVSIVDALGRFYERAGRAEDARAVYAAYAVENPDSNVFTSAVARIGTGERPLRHIEAARDGMAEALLNMAQAFRSDSLADVGLIYGRMALYMRSGHAITQMLVGAMLEGQGRYSDALAIYRRVRPTSPMAWQARFRIAVVLDELGRTDDAIDALEEMAGEKIERADALVSLGDMLRRRERFGAAADAYDRAIARIGTVSRRHWGLFYARGIALERSRRWQRAEADFLRALDLEPNQPYVLNYLGYSWIDQGINLERATRMIQRAVNQRPNDGFLVDSLGWAYYRLGKFARAARELERAAELMPQDVTINDHLGDAMWMTGRYDEARFQWLRALSFKPEPRVEAQIRLKLDRGLIERRAAEGGN